MILDPESGYGEEYFFDFLLKEPVTELVPASIGEFKCCVNIKFKQSRISSKSVSKSLTRTALIFE